MRLILLALTFLAVAAGCSRESDDTPPAADDAASTAPPAEPFEIAPGLAAQTLRRGHGRAAVAGDVVNVHYTGWLFDDSAPDNRGVKFDSSVDRGQRFQFQLGAGRVIQGWEQGVAGMLIGEKRLLTIAPEMAYGDRDMGVIPPGSTLIFEVELFGLENLGDAGGAD